MELKSQRIKWGIEAYNVTVKNVTYKDVIIILKFCVTNNKAKKNPNKQKTTK